MTDDLQMWNVPNRVLFGSGAASETGQYVEQFGAERVLVVTDTGVRAAGVLDPVVTSLDDVGVEYQVFDGVEPDPTDVVVHEAAEAYEAANADLVLGIGGGSSIDTAKAASILATNDGHVLDFEGSGNVPNETPPSVLVPTTAGTGSEVGHWTIVKDAETGIKEEIGDVKLLADLALVDPDLTASAPPRVKAATGMDVVTHAVEAYVSIRRQSQTSTLALDSIEKAGANLRRAVGYRGGDDDALAAMARASTQAGMAFNGAGLGAVHALSHQIGGAFGVPHGLANAVVLPYVMEYNLPQVPEEMVDVAEALGEDVDRSNPATTEGYRAVRAVRRLADDVGIPRTLAETAAERDAIDRLADRALDDGSLTGNPRRTGHDDLAGILDRAFDGRFAYESILGA
ncbi:iron-containing alcohol dehydrogenase family protein [Salinirubellus sp. GCM10025818]|uniref:iron-containing alcohol dehydrogenase family protein n=1 Tax=Salinirubellus TaxID=2162630 RepID=UPI0030D60C41